MPESKLVVIGEVVKPHGIRGELCVESHAESPSLFAPGRRVGLRPPGGPVRFVKILSSRPHQGRVLMFVEGVADRNAAETLRRVEMVVPAEDMPPLAEGEVYLHEMIGYDVLLADTGRKIGVLESFLDVPGQDVWVVRAPDGREILFPANEGTLEDIDTATRSIRVNPPEGLLELYS